MKKILMILVVLIIFSISASAKERYKVTVTVWKHYDYYDGNTLVGTEREIAPAQSFDKCAETPYAAEQEAIKECHTMCEDSYRDEGEKKYKGVFYRCTSRKEVDSASATPLNINC
ncbi:MAG: hypothetical protein LBS69_13025 [Prevotellaceae bacterium]|jgi:hypothetical protein|nr:hypothetical protein [Prevotellaceae bacterium]